MAVQWLHFYDVMSNPIKVITELLNKYNYLVVQYAVVLVFVFLFFECFFFKDLFIINLLVPKTIWCS